MTSYRVLPDHPEEKRLRAQEREIADTLEDLLPKATAALREHRRVDAAVALSQLALTSDLTRKAMEKAVSDQMKVKP